MTTKKRDTLNLTSAEVGASNYNAAVDRQGTVWLYLPEHHGWGYLSSHTWVSWDIHDTLPEQYSPYRGLDEAAAEAILDWARKHGG